MITRNALCKLFICKAAICSLPDCKSIIIKSPSITRVIVTVDEAVTHKFSNAHAQYYSTHFDTNISIATYWIFLSIKIFEVFLHDSYFENSNFEKWIQADLEIYWNKLF